MNDAQVPVPGVRPRGARLVDGVLLLAVLAAIALAIAGVAVDPSTLPAGAVASVNGQPIARADYEAMVQRVAAQLAQPPGAAERAEILERMIDEELLIQRGIALGLPRSEGRLRSMLVTEVMNQALAGERSRPVQDAELTTFYASNAGYFSRPALLRVRRYGFANAGAVAEFRTALEGGDLAGMDGFAEARDAVLPDAGMPLPRLRDYVGEAQAARIAALAPGQILEQPQQDGRVDVYLLVEAQPGRTPDFAGIHAEVETEFRRRRDEQVLTEYLASLRAEARLVLTGAED